MSVSNEKITYLFNRYFEKSATAEECNELFGLLNLSAHDEQLTILLRQAWNNFQNKHSFFEPSKSEQILNAILRAESEDHIVIVKPIFNWRRYAAAAAILLVMGLGLLLVLRPVTNNKLIVKVKQHDAMPGGNKAILTLANGAAILLDSAHNGIIAKQGNSIINKTQNGQVVYNTDNAVAGEDVQMNTVTTPRGGQYQVVLPDGTKVWLNAASSIKYPTAFTGKQRRVEMYGEVYFEVAKNAAKPFIVKANRGEVEVLGTHFNIMDYNDESLMKTTLLEGSVKVTRNGSSKTIRPGEQALVNENNEIIVTSNIDVDEVIAWKNGLFQFTDSDIRTIMRQASRWYDVDVIYEGKIPEKQYTGRIARNVKASQLINMLKFTGLNARIDDDKIFIKN
jgi:transmembrane sensor